MAAGPRNCSPSKVSVELSCCNMGCERVGDVHVWFKYMIYGRRVASKQANKPKVSREPQQSPGTLPPGPPPPPPLASTPKRHPFRPSCAAAHSSARHRDIIQRSAAEPFASGRVSSVWRGPTHHPPPWCTYVKPGERGAVRIKGGVVVRDKRFCDFFRLYEIHERSQHVAARQHH